MARCIRQLVARIEELPTRWQYRSRNLFFGMRLIASRASHRFPMSASQNLWTVRISICQLKARETMARFRYRLQVNQWTEALELSLILSMLLSSSRWRSESQGTRASTKHQLSKLCSLEFICFSSITMGHQHQTRSSAPILHYILRFYPLMLPY